MKLTIFIAVIFLSSITQMETCFAQAELSSKDSIAIARRQKAIVDFSQGKFSIPASNVSCNSLYAEEVFFNISKLKVEFVHDWSMCGTGMEEYYFQERCYNYTLDSLMFLKYGRDIYTRITEEGKFLELHDPNRYPSDDDPFAMNRIQYTSMHDSVVTSHIVYPPSAIQDSTEGKVLIKIDFDSTGKIVKTSVMRGVRSDLDSAALKGVAHIPAVRPDFRWGSYQSGSFIIPIQFAIKD